MTKDKFDIKFVRPRLFACFVVLAFYALFNPKRCLRMLEDFNKAEDERQKAELRERILRTKERQRAERQ